MADNNCLGNFPINQFEIIVNETNLFSKKNWSWVYKRHYPHIVQCNLPVIRAAIY